VDRNVLLVVAGLGVAGWLWAVLVSRSPREGVRQAGVSAPFILAAVLLPVLLFLAARLIRPPAFSSWGLGLLLGAAGGLLAAWTSLSPRHRSPTLLGEAARVAAPKCVVLVAVALSLLWAQTAPVEVLVAVPIGWTVVSIVLLAGLFTATGQPGGGEGGALEVFPMVSGLGFAVALAAVTALGAYRADAARQLGWSAAATVLAAGVPFALLLGALSDARLSGARPAAGLVTGWRVVLSAAVLLGLGSLLAQRVIAVPELVPLVGMGLILALALWWLVVDIDRSARARGPAFSAPEVTFAGALAAAVVLTAFTAAFYLLAGYGVGVMLLATWPVLELAVLPLPRREPAVESDAPPWGSPAMARHVSRLLLFGVLLLLYRLFATRFGDDLRGVTLTDEFALIGVLAGMVLPSLLAGFLERAVASGVGWYLVRLVLVLAAAFAVPGTMLVIWGTKMALALLAGLALAALGSRIGRGEPSDERAAISEAAAPDGASWASLLPPLFALVAALALTVWMHPVVQLAEQTRATRIRLVGWVLGLLILAILAADYGGRISNWWRWRHGRLSGRLRPEGAAR